MTDGAHLLIPFAASRDQGCRQVLGALRLPALQRLLARLEGSEPDTGDEHTLTMPHERALARACGLFAGDGQVPWAAWQLAQAGQDPGGDAWAWLTPCHWQVGRDRIVMEPPPLLQLDAADSQALLDAMQPYFEQDGITLSYEAPTLWRARGEPLRHLPCASLDRVTGRTVDDWLPRTAEARTIRRLQQEMQMLLYTHEINEARLRGGLRPVNSFWVSGAGALPPGTSAAPPPGLHITHYLRDAALRGDWAAWAAAWQQLDQGEVARQLQRLDEGEPVRLTLCGERSARTWRPGAAGWWRRVSSAWRPQPLSPILEQL
ncbi:hypothetical protein [Ramlibacter tataouinensis]|uniref:Phosphoglycerate mutase n=1 Tax=Ramlibacter tataouinensis (strain ATCC BAA-407 / DSM 14655 / LMG 21543 / TTB310) TaxID=365046 RepID=F5XXZ2_RAMTT|nr:hypothetical protein [Ramlibacter tataouinensis]AEG94317.1 conserved hypothetical protein [Ramlibacter tataouinensis TTB310]